MSLESRIIRPFDVDLGFETLFDKTQLHFGGQACEPHSSIIVDSRRLFRKSSAHIIWSPESEFDAFKFALQSAAHNSGIDSSLLTLLVVARSTYLNIADIIWSYPLESISALAPKLSLTATERPRALQASTHGARIDIYIILNQDLNIRQVLKPWRKGTWLAYTTFRIRTKPDSVLFKPYPLDKDKRKDLDLGPNTVRYLYLGDHDPTLPHDQVEPPIFYVDSELLTFLDSSGSSPIAIAIQHQMVIDFISGIIAAVANSESISDITDYEDIRYSLLGRIMNFIYSESSVKMYHNDLIKLITKNPSKLISHLEHAIKYRTSILEVFKVYK